VAGKPGLALPISGILAFEFLRREQRACWLGCPISPEAAVDAYGMQDDSKTFDLKVLVTTKPDRLFPSVNSLFITGSQVDSKLVACEESRPWRCSSCSQQRRWRKLSIHVNASRRNVTRLAFSKNASSGKWSSAIRPLHGRNRKWWSVAPRNTSGWNSNRGSTRLPRSGIDFSKTTREAMF